MRSNNKQIRIILGVLTVAIICAYVAIIHSIHKEANKKNDCDSLDKLIQDKQILNLYKINTAVRCGCALSITTWLIVITIHIYSILNRRITGDSFRQEKCTIHVMNWTFIMAYTSWSIYEIAICLNSFPVGYTVTETYFLLCIIADIIPISVVLYTHFKNIHQVNRIFLMSWTTP